jgi:hypothetical protein
MRPTAALLAATVFLCAAPSRAADTAAAAHAAAPADLQAAYVAATAEYRTALAELTAWCRTQGYEAEAKLAAQWHTEPPADKERYYLLPAGGGASGNPISERADFAERFSKLRTARAERLFALATQAAEAGRFSLAVRLVYETLREQPDHVAARKLLGHQSYEGRWLSTYETAKARSGQIWHSKFGWIQAAHAARWDGGERYLNGKWVAAADDARIHSTIERGWEIQTENFLIRTDHSLEEGVRLAERLEQLHQVWRQMFARFHTAEGEWRRLFAGGTPREFNRKRFNVVYYRSREEYVAALKKREPRIEQTSGIYMLDDDKAYFYAGAERRDEFLFHEVTHQLFAQSRRTTGRIGAKGNFWIVEGIACHMESLDLGDAHSPGPDWADVGGAGTPRMTAARFRRLNDNFYVPLADFCRMTLVQVQQDPRIATLYSQASGLASFLLHGEGGKYREATVDYLLAVYAGSDTPATLAEKAGSPYAELDAQYKSYLLQLPAP